MTDTLNFLLVDLRTNQALERSELPSSVGVHDVAQFCEAHDVAFHSLQSYSAEQGWVSRPDRFRVTTLDTPQRGLNVDFDFVLNWRHNATSFKPALALAAAAGVYGVAGAIRQAMKRGGLVRSIEALDLFLEVVTEELDEFIGKDAED